MTSYTLSDSAQRTLNGAREEAVRLGRDAIGAEHIVLQLLRDDRMAGALQAAGLDPRLLRERLEAGGRRARARNHRSSGSLAYTSHAKRLIEVATRIARDHGGPLMAEHLLLAALQEPRGTMAKLLAEAEVPPEQARAEVLHLLDTPTAPAPVQPSRPGGPAGPAKPSRRIPWRYILLGAVPLSLALSYWEADARWVFGVACLAVLPLAGLMGDATEHIAQRTGPTVGGLLNATFGNAAELIIAIVALRAGLVDLVKASITGSILGNLLLILGLSLVAGGLRRPELRFNRTGAGMSAAMLALAVAALVFPALFHALHPEAAARATELYLSEVVAVILLATYGFSLLFSLRTHRRMFSGEPHPIEGPSWSITRAVVTLGLATAGVAVESEILVHAAEEVTHGLGLSPLFLGLIIIPIIGNAAEHAAAVVFAHKGQMDLAIQIALGSSTQIALLVAPVLVFAGLLLGQQMDLVFRPFEVMALGLATVVIAIITLDGESHWFEGVQLLALYGLVGAAAFFLV